MSDHPGEEEQHLSTLDELELTQEQIHNFQALLRDLPEIYERKFNERLKPLLDRNQQLIDEREQLLNRLHPALMPADQANVLMLSPSITPTRVDLQDSTRSKPFLRSLKWLVVLALLGLAVGAQLSRLHPVLLKRFNITVSPVRADQPSVQNSHR